MDQKEQLKPDMKLALSQFHLFGELVCAYLYFLFTFVCIFSRHLRYATYLYCNYCIINSLKRLAAYEEKNSDYTKLISVLKTLKKSAIKNH